MEIETMANTTATFIKSNGKAEAVKGVKAVYDAATKTYTTKETMKVSACWYKASYKKNGELRKEERVVLRGSKGMAMVCTKMKNGKVRMSEPAIARIDGKDEETREAYETVTKAGFEALKKYMIAKYELQNMKWDTFLKKIGAIAEVVEESKEEEEVAA